MRDGNMDILAWVPVERWWVYDSMRESWELGEVRTTMAGMAGMAGITGITGIAGMGIPSSIETSNSPNLALHHSR